MYDNLIFEGEVLNGLKNGRGRFYNSDCKLIFEGEYLNDVKHGEFKEYYYDGNLAIEGEYFFGRKWNAKIYDINDNYIYELKNGKGFIKEFDYNK